LSIGLLLTIVAPNASSEPNGVHRGVAAFDVDGDGIEDYLVLPIITHDNLGDPNPREVIVASGASGEPIFSLSSGESWDQFGILAIVGSDLDGDGISEILVSAPTKEVFISDRYGRVYVFSGATGEEIGKLHGRPSDRFGLGVDVLPDDDGDGIDEILVDAISLEIEGDDGDGVFEPTSETAYYSARTLVFSGASFELLRDHQSPLDSTELFGSGGSSNQASMPADLDNNGVIDTADLAMMLGVFGTQGPLGDFNADGIVDTADLGILVSAFGDKSIFPSPRVLFESFILCDLFFDDPACDAFADLGGGSSGGGGTGGNGDPGGTVVGYGGSGSPPVDPPCSITFEGGDPGYTFGETGLLIATRNVLNPTSPVSWSVDDVNGSITNIVKGDDSFRFDAVDAANGANTLVTITAVYSDNGECQGQQSRSTTIDIAKSLLYIDTYATGGYFGEMTIGDAASLVALAKPAGGVMSWEVIDGSERIQISAGGPENSLSWLVAGPPGPVSVKATYTVDGSVEESILTTNIVFVPGADADFDQLTDQDEIEIYGTDPLLFDTDGDLLIDGIEVAWGYDPLLPNTDGVGPDDGYEDPDADKLLNAREQALGCDPFDPDTDGDMIEDGCEDVTGTNPRNLLDPPHALSDSDGDGLTNQEECDLGTDASNPDSDADGVIDGCEVDAGFDPLSPFDWTTADDANGDGIPELAELCMGIYDPTGDIDGDGLTNSQEIGYMRCSDPLSPDSDGDGLWDGMEVSLGTGPCTADTDGDGMNDGFEVAHGFDPLNADENNNQKLDGLDDSDMDGLINTLEFTYGTDPREEDSDGDGADDGVEIAQRSDPNSEADNGEAPLDDGLEPFLLTFTSGQYSSWSINIERVGTFYIPYGESISNTIYLDTAKGHVVTITFGGTEPARYRGSCRHYMEYSSTLVPENPDSCAQIIESDPSAPILNTGYSVTCYDSYSCNPTEGKYATVKIHSINVITGPNYSGIYATSEFSVLPEKGADPIESIEWNIDSGESLLTEYTPFSMPGGLIPDDVLDAISFVSNGTPGDVTLTATITTSGGTNVNACSVSHTMSILKYDEINIRYRAFIPCEAVHAPTVPWLQPYEFYGGDDRVLGYSSASFRASFDVNINVSDFHDQTELVLPNQGPSFGITTAYDENGAELVAGACNVALLGPPPVAVATLQATLSNHRIEWLRLSPNSMRLRFGLNAGNPLVPGACVIGSNLFIDLEQTIDPETGEQTTSYDLFSPPDIFIPDHSDGHSAFPAHELYIQSGAAAVIPPPIQYDPIPLGGTILWLCPPIRAPIGYSRTSNPPGNIEGELVTSTP
jgi:hypothetical protein